MFYIRWHLWTHLVIYLYINFENKHIMPRKGSRHLTKRTVVEQWHSDGICLSYMFYLFFIIWYLIILHITLFFWTFTIVHSLCFWETCLIIQLFSVITVTCPGLMVQGWVSVLNTLPSVCTQSHEILAPFQKSTCM